jgi:signal transduction histidine kinase
VKCSGLVCFAFVVGVLGTLLIDVALWKRSQGELDKQYQSRVDKVFDSSRALLTQHRIMMDALSSFFNASNEVTKAEFTLFAKDLLKIKSARAFTLDPQLQPKFLSDPEFYDAVSEGSAYTDINGQIAYDIKDFSTIVINIDEPKHPYLVYAVSHQRLQQKIDTNNDICERFTIGASTLSNVECQSYEGRGFGSLFRHSSELFVDLPEYNTSYHLSVDYMPTKIELLEIAQLILVCTLLGLLFSLLFSLMIQNRIDKEKQRIESNSKLALLSTLNHEIRTPINAVLGYANMLKAQACCSLSGKETLDKIIWSANLLNSVAQNTLTYSKASSGTLKLHYEEIDFPKFLHKIDDYYRAFSHTHKKHLKMQLAGDIPEFIQLDDTKFFQLTTNFINNAFKYSTGDLVVFNVKVRPLPQKLVALDIGDKPLDGFIRVAVKDFGKGMSKASMEAIVKPFTTDLKSSSALKSGIGIGLYTCKKVIESVGGSIRIRSRKDQGTLVIFQFPFRLTNTESDQEVTVEPMATQYNPRVSILPQKETNQLASNVTINQTNVTNGKHVLLVDDNCFNLEVCKSMLESDGYSVTTAKDGRESINALNRFYGAQLQDTEVLPLIVLMDYMLDETDGLTLISSLKKLGFHQPEYFILSANSKDEIPKSALFPDIAFLQKPIDIKTIRALNA